MARKPLENASDSAKIIDELMRKENISLSEMARRAGISRQAMIMALGSNIGFNNFLKYLDLLGYGITIRPKTVGLGIVDMADKDMCEKCLYKKLADIVDEIREKSAEMVTSKVENPETEIE